MNLSDTDCKKIVNNIHDAIEQYSRDKYPSEHRAHLGASIVGNKCSRKSWYTFRWCKLDEPDGRMRRLFQRGHREEQIFIEVLRGIGFKIWEVDPKTNKQFRIYGCERHFGGSGDSKAIIPWLPDEPVLLEFKTHNTKSFCYLVDKGLKLGKPEHYAQMSLYGKGYQYKYGLYCAINKNDDEYHFELVELDWQYAQQLENKAQDIITSKVPPQRISDNPSYFDCKYCAHNSICHYNEAVDKNCRSCKMAIPEKAGEWFCSKWNAIIPKDEIIKGCGEHASINN